MSLRIALFGQAAFGRDVLLGLAEAGHTLAGVYAPPEGARPDPLAEEAEGRGIPLFRHRRFRRKGAAIPERIEEHRALRADLNVLAFVTVILPEEIVDGPPRGSLCFHPSLLPRFRGGSALAWQIILGEKESGVTVFRPDAGVDTGPIVVQKAGVAIEPGDTAGSLYFRKLYPLGVEAMLAAVAAVDAGTSAPQPQDEARATHQGLVDDEVARIDWRRPAEELDRLVRGCDPQPGAHTRHGTRPLRLYDGRLLRREPAGSPGCVEAVADGELVVAARGGALGFGRVRVDGGAKVPGSEAGLSAGDQLG